MISGTAGTLLLSYIILKNYYQILSIEIDSTERNIRETVYKLGKQNHPNKRKSATNNPLPFIAIIEAHTVLTDHRIREMYDWILDASRKDIKGFSVERCKLLIDQASKDGIEKGNYYSHHTYSEFKDDYRPNNWWGFWDWEDWVDYLFFWW